MMPYYENIDQFYIAKTEEQVEIRAHEIKALRAALKEQHAILLKVMAVKKRLQANGKYHHLLKQFEPELDEIFNTIESHLGRERKR